MEVRIQKLFFLVQDKMRKVDTHIPKDILAMDAFWIS